MIKDKAYLKMIRILTTINCYSYGMSVKEIAKQGKMSPRTVRKYIAMQP